MNLDILKNYSDSQLEEFYEKIIANRELAKDPKVAKVWLAIEYKKCKDNMLYFIENYVHIEDRDSPTLATLFKLWDGQKLALDMFLFNRLNIVLKARQLGLTWLALALSSSELLFKEGYQVVALSKKEEDAKELVRRVTFIFRYLPKWMVVEDTKDNEHLKIPKYRATTMSVTIVHPDGENSVFNAMSAGQDSGRSFTANMVVIDEWAFQPFAYEIWAAAYPTINRPTGGKVIGLSTAKRMTLFEEIWGKSTDKLNTFKQIFLDWRTDPRRTDKWYEQTKADLPLSYKAEYPNTPEEAFEASEGVAFGEFSRLIHVCTPFEIPAHWRRWRSVDNGYTDPYFWIWYAVSEDGVVYAYREFTRDPKRDPKITYSEQAERALMMTKNETIGYTVVGHDAWNVHHMSINEHTPAGKSMIDYYLDGGITNCIKAVTNRTLGKATVHEYLKPYVDENVNKTVAKLQIFDTCTTLIKTLPQLLCDEADAEKVADSNYCHGYDSLYYGLISYHASRTVLEDRPDYNKMSSDMISDYRRASKEDRKRLVKKWNLHKRPGGIK